MTSAGRRPRPAPTAIAAALAWMAASAITHAGARLGEADRIAAASAELPEVRELARRLLPAASDPSDEAEEVQLERAYWQLSVRTYPFDWTPAFDPAAGAARKRREEEAMRESARSGATTWLDGTWRHVGPDLFPGRITALELNTDNPSVAYAGAAGGGVWRVERDADGQWGTWQPLSDDQESLVIGALAIDASRDERSATRIWAGTGEGNYASDSLANVAGRGILASTDAGASWRPLAFAARNFHELVRTPDTTEALWAATTTGLYRSADGARSWTPTGGDLGGGDVTDVLVSAHAKDVVIAALRCAPNAADDDACRRPGGLHRSTDGGRSFAPIAATLAPHNGRAVLTECAPDATAVMYAAITWRQGPGKLTGRLRRLLRSTDAGASWHTILAGGVEECPNTASPGVLLCSRFARRGWFALALACDPERPDVVHLGSQHLHRIDRDAAGWRDWSTGEELHDDIHDLVATGHGLWVAGDGGVHRRGGAEGSFAPIGTGLRTAQLYHLDAGVDRLGRGRVVVGAQDQGALLLEPDRETRLATGDFTRVAFHPDVPGLLWIHRTRLFFQSQFETGQPGVWLGFPTSVDQRYGEGAWAAPFAFDRHDPRRLLAGGRRLYRRELLGAGRAISPELTDDWITALDQSPVAADELWVGTRDGHVWHGAPGVDAPWSRADHPRTVTSISAHPATPGVAFVSSGGDGAGRIRRHAADGASEDLTGDLPAVHVSQVLALGRGEDPPLLAATDLGVWFLATPRPAGHWRLVGAGLPNASVQHLRHDRAGERLLAATYGRGAWSLALPARGPAATR